MIEGGKKLPSMVKRFAAKRNDSERSRDGYGGGTYWPAGWGEPIAADAVAANGYRLKEDMPLRYRRRDEWRASRDHFIYQDIVNVYESQRQQIASTGSIAFPLVKQDDVDAIDRAIVQILAVVGTRSGSLEVDAPVRYLRARTKLLYNQLREKQAPGLPSMEIVDDEEVIRFGKLDDPPQFARLAFEDSDLADPDAVRGPHLVLHWHHADAEVSTVGEALRSDQ